ncbi:hypothetical protein [Arthrospiribacter ruber]|uniref:Lipoprotein n=1 Tax=Arthrospiribacter ruber TaxID=2487934 RepID=A0A951IZ64_9BACT|nr:hypothetical protein [Arthrospiribacter ruber]MBW3468093.1 hypothetical protein [Arthrospiribacter ruber]
MKKAFLPLFLSTLIFSCQFDQKEDPIDGVRADSELDDVTDALHNTFFEFEVEGGDQDRSFEDRSEGLHGIYGVSRTDANNLEGNNRNLYNCFQSIGLSLPQMNQIRAATNSFSACRNNVSRNYRSEFSSLLKRVEDERKRIVNNQQANPIAIQNQLTALRNRFRKDLMDLKLEYSEELRTCLRSYIAEINRRLNEGQWNEFKECVLD